MADQAPEGKKVLTSVEQCEAELARLTAQRDMLRNELKQIEANFQQASKLLAATEADRRSKIDTLCLEKPDFKDPDKAD